MSSANSLNWLLVEQKLKTKSEIWLCAEFELFLFIAPLRFLAISLGSIKMDKPVSPKTKIKEVLAICEEVCISKGWNYYLRNLDEKKSRFATIEISRNFEKDCSNEKVSAEIEVLIDKTIRISAQNTSFHNYGIQALIKAIVLSLDDLKWAKKRSPSKSPDSIVETLLSRFDKSARQIKRRYNARTSMEFNDEYDVQNFLHSLLISLFEDVRPEEYTPSYAGSASRTDFLLKKEQIMIETKMTNKSLKDKKLGEQLIIDIKKYQVHPNCKKLYCLVYDPNTYISNPVAIENDLNGKHDNLEVKVFIVPK